MTIITDEEFGEIVVKKRSLAKTVSLKIAPDGRIQITMPPYAPLLAAKALIKTSRKQIRELVSQYRKKLSYTKNQQIGKSHNLLIQTTAKPSSVKIVGTQILAEINEAESVESAANQQLIRSKILVALRKEAKSYLPRRLSFLAEEHGFSFARSKITHSSSRWGSCSSSGTISLNIGMMNLPFELIDYVIIHELCHTRHMNHSTKFWDEVAKFDPYYKIHRNELKKYSPYI